MNELSRLLSDRFYLNNDLIFAQNPDLKWIEIGSRIKFGGRLIVVVPGHRESMVEPDRSAVHLEEGQSSPS